MESDGGGSRTDHHPKASGQELTSPSAIMPKVPTYLTSCFRGIDNQINLRVKYLPFNLGGLCGSRSHPGPSLAIQIASKQLD